MRRTSIVALWLMMGVVCAAEPVPFDFESLRALVQQHGQGGPEAVIEALPADLRSRFTLVFASRSLQGASWTAPRAVLFGTNARLIVTFNGDPAERGHAALETMEFDAAANRFLFREIAFTPTASGFDATISAANPPRCTACHGVPARPIWDAAPLWPGVYGERYGAGLSAAERRGMRQFLAGQPTDPRYRHLIGAAALAQRGTYVADSRSRYDGGRAEPPNARLSVLLATYNVQSILAQLAAQPGFSSRLALLAGVSDAACGTPEVFYPGALREQIAEEYRTFVAVARGADRRQALANAGRHDGRGGARQGLVMGTDTTPLRFVTEREFGLSTARWTLAFESDSHDLAAPAGAPTLADGLRAWALHSDPALADAATYRSFGASDRYCARLCHTSREALQTWYADHGPPDGIRMAAVSTASRGDPARPALLERCAACHDGEVAPRIPFADPEALRPLLVGGDYARGRLVDEILFRLAPEAGALRMPRGLNLSSGERESLERYFIAAAAPRSPD